MPTERDDSYTAPARSAVERHFQTFVGVVMVALLFWIFNSVQDLTVKVAVQNLNIQILSKTIEKLSVDTDDRYRSTEAKRDFYIRDAEINDIKKRITNLERRGYVR